MWQVCLQRTIHILDSRKFSGYLYSYNIVIQQWFTVWIWKWRFSLSPSTQKSYIVLHLLINPFLFSAIANILKLTQLPLLPHIKTKYASNCICNLAKSEHKHQLQTHHKHCSTSIEPLSNYASLLLWKSTAYLWPASTTQRQTAAMDGKTHLLTL